MRRLRWLAGLIEFDGHKIDLRVTVRVIDPFGFETLLELTRIWILVLLDVASRAVIGYKVALSKEYNKDDVASALEAALTPHRPRQYKIPGLAVRQGGCYPSEVLPETQFACWEWFRFDGAKSHLASDTLPGSIKSSAAGRTTDRQQSRTNGRISSDSFS